MHTTHWSHATKIENIPPTNLIQIGIGGWIGNHRGVEVAEQIDTTVLTMFDVDEIGIDRVMDIALELAWKDVDAVYLSFDIDVVDPGFARVKNALPSEATAANAKKAERSYQFKYQGHGRARDR